MGYKDNDACLNKAFPDERLFILMTRDNTAPLVVLEWIKMNMFTQSEEKLKEAFETALEMKRNMGAMVQRKEMIKKNTILTDTCLDIGKKSMINLIAWKQELNAKSFVKHDIVLTDGISDEDLMKEYVGWTTDQALKHQMKILGHPEYDH
jgi:hypothetical protein